MAIIKHIAIKNSNYDAAVDYLSSKHDEFTNKPILDEHGDMIPRDEFLLTGLNCNPFTFGRECEAINAKFHKNQTKKEIKAHHYIISFDPRDKDENGLTMDKAQKLATAFAKKNFPGHQTIICVHPDGHSSSGNIHVHIVINSVRKLDVEPQEYMERPGDALAGHKHHVTKQLLDYLKQETMNMCQKESLYQVDLLNPAKVRITDREYWAKRKGQAALDQENAERIAGGEGPANIKQTEYKTDKDFLRDAINAVLSESISYKDFCKRLLADYGIEVGENRGRISYLYPGKQKPIRGRQLGSNFEKEHIEAVIERNLKPYIDANDEVKNAGPGKYQGSGIRLLTDLEKCLKAQGNQYYARKVKISNLQKMADTLAFVQCNNIESIDSLDKLLSATSADAAAKRKAVKSTEAELKAVNLLIKNTGQYLANKATYRQYLNSKNKKDFREQHRTELSLYEAARKYLQENCRDNSINPTEKKNHFTCPNLKELKVKKQELTSQKNLQYEEYSYAQAKLRKLQTVASNVHTILDAPEKQLNREKGEHII